MLPSILCGNKVKVEGLYVNLLSCQAPDSHGLVTKIHGHKLATITCQTHTKLNHFNMYPLHIHCQMALIALPVQGEESTLPFSCDGRLLTKIRIQLV